MQDRVLSFSWLQSRGCFRGFMLLYMGSVTRLIMQLSSFELAKRLSSVHWKKRFQNFALKNVRYLIKGVWCKSRNIRFLKNLPWSFCRKYCWGGPLVLVFLEILHPFSCRKKISTHETSVNGKRSWGKSSTNLLKQIRRMAARPVNTSGKKMAAYI